jgi:LacI family transcriptional regulator
MKHNGRKGRMSVAQPKKKRTVLVVLRMTGASGRSLLEGVFQYVKRGIHWNVRLMQMPDMLTPSEVAACEHEGIDGIITSELGTTPETAAALRDTPIPLAVISVPDPILANRTAPTVFVANNEEAIGAEGVRFFRTLGAFNSFGFVQNFKGFAWSDLRAKGFCDEVASFGGKSSVFRSPSPLNMPPVDLMADRIALAQWLKGLSKPAAVMADWDWRATQILEICNTEKIKVPSQISVLGVDDDVLLCDFTTPAL